MSFGGAGKFYNAWKRFSVDGVFSQHEDVSFELCSRQPLWKTFHTTLVKPCSSFRTHVSVEIRKSLYITPHSPLFGAQFNQDTRVTGVSS